MDKLVSEWVVALDLQISAARQCDGWSCQRHLEWHPGFACRYTVARLSATRGVITTYGPADVQGKIRSSSSNQKSE